MTADTPPRKVKLAYLASHPIQYQSPLLRRIAQEPDIDLTVFFGSDFSVRAYRDEGFNTDVQWDVPLLEGFRSEFLPTLRDNGTNSLFNPIAHGLLSRLSGFDALWVHGYATTLAMQGILAANLLGIPVLLRSDSTLIDRPRSSVKLAAKSLFFSCLRPMITAALTSGTLNDAYWRTSLGDDLPRFLMPYAVDNAWFERQTALASTRRTELQADLGLDPTRPVILFASKLQPRKHCDDLIAAYRRIVSRQALPSIPYLLIVGDGEQRPALEQQAAGLEGVRFCGFRNQSKLPRFFDIASVFVLPARHEPWGLIVNEVMNAAVPVILSSDVGCHPDLLSDGVEGFLYPVRDIDALAHAIERTLATPETAANLGQNALRRIQSWGFEQNIAGLRRALTHVTRIPL